MYKFFVETNQIQENNIYISNNDVKHIVNVLRMKKGERISIGDKITGESYIVEIENIFNGKVVCKIIQKIKNKIESDLLNVDIYQGIPKMDKMEYIIQKTTEIGIRNIYPVKMERCIVKLDERTLKKKIDRWQRIAEVAAKQSKRDLIPQIKSLTTIKEICKNVANYDIILVGYEKENKTTLKEVLKKLRNINKSNIAIIIGPEGGIESKEITSLEQIGAKCVSLGKRILRTETAGLVMLSNILYEYEL